MVSWLRRRRDAALDARLVWIFSSPRSGSTWLLELLAEHDEVVPVNEPQLGSHLAPIMAEWPGVHPDDLSVENFTWPRLAAGVETYFFCERHAGVWRPRLAELIRARFRVHARGSALLAIKEPNGTQAADLILGALPRSRLLFLLRDGRDVVDSELDAYTRGSWMSKRYPAIRGLEPSQRMDFIVQSAHKWLWRTELCEEMMRTHPGPRHQVRYEELRREPATVLAQVFEWLGLAPRNAGAIADRHAFEHVPERGPGEFHRAASPGGWREHLSAAEQAELERIVGAKVRELGYA
jgi:hypothetical protein